MQATAFKVPIVMAVVSICVFGLHSELVAAVAVTTPEREVVGNPWQVFLQQVVHLAAANDNENVIAGQEAGQEEHKAENFILKHKLPATNPIPSLSPRGSLQKPNWQLGQNVGGLTSTIASSQHQQQQPCQWAGNTVCTTQYDPVCVTDLRCISILQNKCYLNKLNCNCQNLHVLHPQFCNNFAQSNYKRCNLKIYIQ